MFHRTWRVRQSDEQVFLVRGPGGAPTERAHLLPRRDAIRLLDRWSASSALAERAFAGVISETEGFGVRAPSSSGLRTRLADALSRGELRVFKAPCRPDVFRLREEEVEPGPTTGPVKALTWISIEVLDDRSPPRPVPHLPYRIHLSDGSTVDGRLDDRGQARVEGVVAGECQVTFPTVDASEWKPL